MEKESVDLHVMWHIDALLQPYPVSIVTTVDKAGRLNAAPLFPCSSVLFVIEKPPDAFNC